MGCAARISGRMEQVMDYVFFIIILILLIAIFFLGREVWHYGNRTQEEIDKVQKGLEFYDILVRWLTLKQEHKTLRTYFEENGYRTAAIYGMKEIGMLLLEEMRQERIDVRYAIDRNADGIDADIAVLKPSCEMPDVDVILVTASHYFDMIYLELSEHTNADIVPVEDMFWAL